MLTIGHGGQTLLSHPTAELVQDALPRGAALRDLGSHRLKDLQRPEQVFQLVHGGLAEEFPPLRSLDSLPHNLPLQPTSFIGREREIAELRRLLASNRLVTLTGTGGSGKTRLALQLAAELVESYSEGVWFVELGALTDPELVPQTVATALGVREVPGRPVAQTLAEWLKPKKALLILDSCEHLVGACAELAAGLLRSCPGLTLVATSREALGTAGELVWSVPTLAVPDPRRLGVVSKAALTNLTQYEAVRLFIERAGLAKPGFAVSNANAPAVAQICHRLDGIPLAIELAAGRVKALAPEQIAGRLDDRFRLLTGGSRTALPRHQTLRAAIDWSHELLSEPERLLLRRLAVFSGGWTLEAAEAVCGDAGLDPLDVLEVQSHLIDKSLVLSEGEAGGETRYRLLGTIRQYGLERLAEAAEAEVLRAKHGGWCLELAERAYPELMGREQKLWLDRLEQEHDNFRAALEGALKAGQKDDAGVQLAGALFRFWYVRGHLSEGQQWLASALANPGGEESRWRPRALRGAGILAMEQGRKDEARAFLEESLARAREAGDDQSAVGALQGLGMVALEGGDLDRAEGLMTEALSLARRIEQPYVANLVIGLGEVARLRGDFQGARTRYEEGLRSAGDTKTHGAAVALFNLGQIALHEGEVVEARERFGTSLETCLRLGDRANVAGNLEGLAGVWGLEGDWERAASLLGCAGALREALSAPLQAADRPVYERTVAGARAALGEAAFAEAEAKGRALTPEAGVALALEPVQRVQT